MRNTKLWSVLFVAALLCACVVGLMPTGASASDTRIPTATVTYVVGTDGANISACLEKAAGETWGKNDVLEIQFSDEDSSTKGNSDSNVLFEAETIFREDDTQLPIVIRGTDADRGAKLLTDAGTYNAANDYYFTDLTVNGGVSSESIVVLCAGSGELVFENTTHNNTKYTYYYGDNQNMDAYEGWDAAKVSANANENGLVETGIVFGNGVTGLNPGALEKPYDDMHFTAVGYNGNDEVNGYLISLKRPNAEVTELMTDDEVEKAREEAKKATFAPGNKVTDCIVKPCDTAAYMVVDVGTVATASSTTADLQYTGARKGLSPVGEATLEVISGGIHYLAADGHTAGQCETVVGDTNVIIRGGRLGGYGDVGIRLTNHLLHIGDLTFEIHEDNAEVPTYTPWIQTVGNSSTKSTRVYGDYYFLVTGGTLGKAVSSTANGYYGAPPATGTVINEVRGGQIWQFSSVRYGGEFIENTPISTTLPGTGDELVAKVAVRNIISGGTFGGVNSDGAVVDNTGYFVGSRDGGDANTPPSVCSEITGGTFYRFAGGNRTYSNNFDAHIYNFISGTETKYPTFLKDFHGACSYRTTREVTNVIKGTPVFRDEDGTARNIFGGTTLGTVRKINNYLSGMPVFNDFYGGASGGAPTQTAYNNAVVGDIYNCIALDATETVIKNFIWGGNGYYAFKDVDGAASDLANENNRVSGSLVTDVYSGTFGTFRAESCSGQDQCDIVANIYGGTWKESFMAVNRTYGKTNNTVSDYTVITNIYDGTFETNLYMGGQNNRNQAIVNNIYGGAFSTAYNSSDNSKKYYGYYGSGQNWALSVENNIYGGTFNGRFYGGGRNGAGSVTNNLYGGTLGPWHDFMGASSATAGSDFDIVNNFYGGDSAANWIYCGNMEGPCGTITNNFHTGADNPCRDSENELHKYYNAATMLEAGFKFRDQVICGSGYTESLYTSNTCDGIINNLGGGCWTANTGSTTWITIHGGMRWGIVNGDIVNNFTEGTYYRFYGGSNYGVITGTITNNYGKELAEGQEEPLLVFANKGSGTSVSIGYNYGGGLDGVDFPAKINSALAVDESKRTALQKMYVSLTEGLEDGEVYNCSTGAIVNNVYYGTYRQFYGGALGLTTAGVTSNIGSITNNIYGGTFTDTKVGSTTHHAYFGGCSRNTTIAEGITNNIYGGVFNSNYYGGTSGSGKVICPSIENHFYAGEGCSTNKTIFLGNGGSTYTGTVHSIFYAADDNYPGFDAKRSYVFGGSSNTQTNTTAEFGVITEIHGGTFIGFWGIGGGSGTVANVNVKTVVTGGVFNPYDKNNLKNSIMGATRNGVMNGNAVLEISGGVFNGHVTGGVVYGSNDAASDVINGNINLNITGGEFNADIYGVTRPGYNVALAEGKTCTVTVAQAAGKALKLGGAVHANSVVAGDDVIEITADTNLVADALTGTLTVHQTEGWNAHDYLKLPATSQYDIVDDARYGSYTEDDTILVKGVAVAPVGATLRLAERVGVRIVLNAEDVEAYGDAFTYEVTLGETVLAEGGYEDICANNYSILFDGIGLAKFGEKFTVTCPVMETMEYSIADLAVMAQTAWAENAKWKAYADALIEFHNVYNLKAENTLTPDAVALVPQAEKGALGDAITAGEATVLMSDAGGVRLTLTLNSVPESVKFVVGGHEFEAVIEGNTVSADIFFAHEALDEEFVISVQNAEGEVYMTYTASVEAMAAQLAADEENVNKANATAFLVYIQKAVACK